jgi:cell division protein FtsZ
MFEYVNQGNAQIKVFGVGGGGSNAVECMIQDNSGLENITFICVNTDAQALQNSSAPIKIQFGSTITAGLGAGANPEIGERSALEDQERIREVLEGSDMVFITAGMGGGTGTGAAPVVAQIAKDLGILTVAVVTKPLHIEGTPRMRSAERGIQELRQHVDSLIEIPNQRLLGQSERGMGLSQTFAIANKILIDAVRGITEIINDNGIINVDFADVRTIMSNQGSPSALMGTGVGRGEQRAISAAAAAVSSPLLNHDITHAQAVLMNFTGGHSMSLNEITEAAETITQEIHGSPQVILGAVVNDSSDFDDETIKVTVIATGFAEGLSNDSDANINTPREKYGARHRERSRSTSMTPSPMSSERSRGAKSTYGNSRPPYSSTAMGSTPPTHRESSSSSSDEHPSWEIDDAPKAENRAKISASREDYRSAPPKSSPVRTTKASRGMGNSRAYQERTSYHSGNTPDASMMPAPNQQVESASRDGYAARPSQGRYEQNPYALRDRNSERGAASSPAARSSKRSGLGSITPVAPLDQPDDAWGGHVDSLESRAYKKRD